MITLKEHNSYNDTTKKKYNFFNDTDKKYIIRITLLFKYSDFYNDTGKDI